MASAKPLREMGQFPVLSDAARRHLPRTTSRLKVVIAILPLGSTYYAAAKPFFLSRRIQIQTRAAQASLLGEYVAAQSVD